MQTIHKLSWKEIYERIHAIKLFIETAEPTLEFIAFVAKSIEYVEQGLLSNFDDIIPQVGEEFNPIFHEQIGYVQDNAISNVLSYGKIKDGTVIFKAKVKR